MPVPEPIAGHLQVRVLEHLWKHGASTVAAVWDALNAQPGAQRLAYTTILTVMRNLVGREMVSVTTGARRHVFTPVVTRAQYRARVAAWVIDVHFGGDQSAALNAVSASRAAKAGG